MDPRAAKHGLRRGSRTSLLTAEVFSVNRFRDRKNHRLHCVPTGSPTNPVVTQPNHKTDPKRNGVETGLQGAWEGWDGGRGESKQCVMYLHKLSNFFLKKELLKTLQL